VKFLYVYHTIMIKKKKYLINNKFENPEYELNGYIGWLLIIFYGEIFISLNYMYEKKN
jgi:hypothetical protein